MPRDRPARIFYLILLPASVIFPRILRDDKNSDTSAENIISVYYKFLICFVHVTRENSLRAETLRVYVRVNLIVRFQRIEILRKRHN